MSDHELNPREPRYPPELEEFLTYVREGLGITQSLQLAKCPYNRYESWCKAGAASWFPSAVSEDQATEPQRSFVLDVEAARAGAEQHLLSIVRRHAEDDGRLALNLLARMFPDRWGQGRETSQELLKAMTQAQPRGQVVIYIPDNGREDGDTEPVTLDGEPWHDDEKE